MTASRRQPWEDASYWPLTITAVVFLVAYAARRLRLELGAPWPTLFRFRFVTGAAWAVFVVEFAGRLGFSRDRARADLAALTADVRALREELGECGSVC